MSKITQIAPLSTREDHQYVRNSSGVDKILTKVQQLQKKKKTVNFKAREAKQRELDWTEMHAAYVKTRLEQFKNSIDTAEQHNMNPAEPNHAHHISNGSNSTTLSAKASVHEDSDASLEPQRETEDKEKIMRDNEEQEEEEKEEKEEKGTKGKDNTINQNSNGNFNVNGIALAKNPSEFKDSRSDISSLTSSRNRDSLRENLHKIPSSKEILRIASKTKELKNPNDIARLHNLTDSRSSFQGSDRIK
eukprot:TRINITY_DN6930_c0_g1_i1.p1 TRINITY_DN6930_c0_g1~~TRINITY_DN6930_c0_g1_i1.p1  ORF type:complete len:247 (-),score=72.41 TRINITY_DN6930_c0_g1_i1:49-789(-)